MAKPEIAWPVAGLLPVVRDLAVGFTMAGLSSNPEASLVVGGTLAGAVTLYSASKELWYKSLSTFNLAASAAAGLSAALNGIEGGINLTNCLAGVALILTLTESMGNVIYCSAVDQPGSE